MGLMEEKVKRDKDRSDQVMESLDLLFSKVGEIDTFPQKVEAQVDMSTQVMEQLLKDQQMLAKQMEATGQAVAKLTMDQMDRRQKEPLSPTSSEASVEQHFHHVPKGRQEFRPHFHQQRKEFGERSSNRNMVPKMAFPRFEGDNPLYGRTNV